jgi:outer membrane protein
MMRRIFLFSVLVFAILVQNLSAQSQQRDSLLTNASLSNVIAYALNRQPTIQQALLDEEITELQIKSKLSEWYPQVNFNYLYQRNIQLQSSVIGGNTVRFGNKNNSAFQFSASQAIFNRDVLLASRTRTEVRQQSKQLTTDAKIDLVSNVSKAFYDVIVSELNRQVANKNIIRQERSLRDTRAKYDAGIVDKTDYKRATIALNNSKALQKNNREATTAKTEYLKSLMNYPVEAELDIQYDSSVLEREIYIDTLQDINYDNRIEYRILLTQRKLQEANVKYNRWSYIPSVSANGAYNINYLNNSFSKLYSASFPQSFAGLTVAFPIFQGGKRKYEIRVAEWELKRTDLDIISLKNNLHSDFIAALSGYKASLTSYFAAKENVQLAQEVYDVIELQYQTGIKTYLEVAVAEADLSTSQINFYNALYQVLSRKIDVQRSLGQISF